MSGDIRDIDHPVTANRQAVQLVGVNEVTTGSGAAATSVVTRQAVSIVNVTLKAANVNRKGLAVYNNSAVSNLFLKLGATADIGGGAESFTARLVPNALYEVPFGYTGIVDGIWDGADANGEALVTELT